MTDHTPTPWFFEKHGDHSEWFGNIIGSYGPSPSGIDQIRTITCNLRHGTTEENAANAALIVKAVNMHQELLGIVGRLANGERSEPGHSALRDAAIEVLAKVASHV